MTKIPVVNVAVTVLSCEDQVLLVRNPKWGVFTFPMTKIRERPLGLVSGMTQREAGSQAALRNVGEVLGTTTTKDAGLLCDVFQLQQGDRTGEVGQYNLQVFGFPVDEPITPPGRDVHWLRIDQVLDPKRQPVSRTARTIAENLLTESQKSARAGDCPPAVGGRDSRSSVALIRRDGKKSQEWLLQFNPKWERFFLVGGHAHPGEDARTCLVREIAEETRLSQEDYKLDSEHPLRFLAWSAGAWKYTNYEMSAFDVALKDNVMNQVNGQAENLWVTATEIHGECTDDGRLISPTVRRVFQELGLS